MRRKKNYFYVFLIKIPAILSPFTKVFYDAITDEMAVGTFIAKNLSLMMAWRLF